MRILVYPDPTLRGPAEMVDDVHDIEPEVQRMIRTMHENRGVGLAAPQVGIERRFCVINTTGEPGDDQVLVNPEIVERRGEVTQLEGCLSVPGLEGKVPRAEWVRVRAHDLEGNEIELEGDGLFARVVQHELDHLDGVLFIDRLGMAQKVMLKRRLKELEKRFHQDGG